MLRHIQVLFFCFCAFVPAQGQLPSAPPSGTNAPPASPAPIPTVALGDVVNQAESTLATLRSQQTDLANDQSIQTVKARLPALTQRIDDQLSEDTKLLEENPSLFNLQNAQASWQAIAGDLTTSKQALATRSNQVGTLMTNLEQMSQTWQATLKSVQSGAPDEALQRIKTVLGSIGSTTKAAQAVQVQVLSVQSRVAEQDSRMTNGLATISKAQNVARSHLFKQDHPPLWTGIATSAGTNVVTQERNSFQVQLSTLKSYLQERIASVYVHLLIFILLTFGFYGIKNVIGLRVEKEAALLSAARVFDVPLATAILVALLVSGWIYPSAPRLLWAAVGVFSVVPAIIILRRLMEPALAPILGAIVIAYFIDQLRYVLTPAGLFSRELLVFELLAASLFIFWLLHSRRLTFHLETDRSKRAIQAYVHIAFFVFIFAGFCNIFGYVHLSTLLSSGMLKSTYLTVLFYAAARIADALTIGVLSIHPLIHFRMVQLYRDLIYRKVSAFIDWLAFSLWLLTALNLFSIRDPLWAAAAAALIFKFSWGSINFSLGNLLAFGITIWASFLISRFLRFILEEEVYPHLKLSRGIPYAASTMVHYTVLVLGFFIALEASNVDLTKFAILAGAIGVGLGFGLQNIMNNFISGIILLFERPIKVGDIIQVDTSMGMVERIGIRASIIRLTNGSEVIIPNGNLISNPVTNWSLTDNKRVIEIPVTVTSKTDPQRILEILTRVARSDSRILQDPSPQALLITLGGTALTFRLRAWIDSTADWMQITSDLSLGINSALAKEEIVVG